MNNHYQTPQSRPYDQRYPPSYQQHSAPNAQQQPGRGSNSQVNVPSINQYGMNGVTQNISSQHVNQ